MPDARSDLPIRIERAFAAHATLLAALHEEIFRGTGHSGWSESAIRTLLSGPSAIGLLALCGEEPAGLALVRVAAGEAEIFTIGTHPAFRTRGVARALLAHLDGMLAGAGIGSLFLEVAVDNAPAMALYEQAGFARAGLRKAYYTRPSPRGGPDGTVDAVVMRRDIV